MDEHELLLRHAASWAQDKKRPLDRDLLETAIGLRDFHDVTAAQEWPAGSVEHLMLVRWPSHGPAEVPDVAALIDTLDTYWRFLRSTGRMRSGSADPKALVKEARRAGEGMRESCADPDRHSPTKALLRFSAESGTPLDEVESPEELNALLQQVMDRFNALPFEERDRWLPGPGAPGNVPTQRASDMLRQALGDGGPGHGLSDFAEQFAESFDGLEEDYFNVVTWDLLPDFDSLVDPPDPAAVAAEVRASPFVQQCLTLAQWVGEGRQVTATGVLRLAPAREVYADLGLWDWELAHRRLAAFPDPWDLDETPGAQQARGEAELRALRSAAHARPLRRLWSACHAAGLIEVGKSMARATPAADLRTRPPEDWVQLGLAVIGSLVANLDAWDAVDPLLGALLPFLRVGVDEVALDAVQSWWWGHPDNSYSHVPREYAAELRGVSDAEVDQLLWLLEDTGVWRREGQVLRRTALGTAVAMMLWDAMEEGTLHP